MQTKRKWLIPLILILLITITLYGETYVLIMGVGDYRNDGIIPLPAAIEDAERIKTAIIELGIAKEQNIRYIKNPVKTDIEIELEELLKKGDKDDRLIVYFAGHSEAGINEAGKKDTYLCGVDVRKDHLQRTAYNFRQDFERIAADLQAKETIMIFDTCYAGGLTTERKLSQWRIEKVAFEDIAANKGVNFLFSSGPEETSGEQAESGWYTHYLLKGLQGDANLDGDDYVTLEELSTYVRQKVSQSTKNRQNPMSLIVDGAIQITSDERKKAEETLSQLTKEFIAGKINTERFQRFGKILAQNESEDTQEEKEIRKILMLYHQTPNMEMAYLIKLTEDFFEVKPITKLIRIETSPTNAAIYINGSYKGTSPLTTQLEEGTHTIEARKDGYETKSQTKTIGTQTKDLSRTETITITLEKETGSVYITSTPSGATIYLNGSYKETTPKTMEGLELGTYTIRLTKTDYEDKTETVQIEKGKTKEIEIKLTEKQETVTTAEAGKTGTGYLKIEGNTGSTYYIDGENKGWIIPKEIKLSVGKHTVEIEGRGQTEIEIKENETTIIDNKTEFGNNYQYIESGVQIGEMVLVKGGTFQMGNTRGDSEGDSDEKPVHTVRLSYDYYMGKTEVTFNEYDAYCEVMGKNKEDDEGWGRGNRPVIGVSWYDAIAYCNWLSEKEGLSKAYDSIGNLLDKNGRQTTDITQVEGYRLPTEAEWEYAARGGHKRTSATKYAGSNSISTVAWYRDNSGRKNHEVGQKAPNELGLYDMSGNVWEWCHDWYDDYPSTNQTNPTGSDSISFRVLRSGSWGNDADLCRVAFRGHGSPDDGNYLGFRIARTRK